MCKVKDELYRICRGIFQGDSFSPLLFIMSLFPLTMILRRCSNGYRLGSKNAIVNHLLYLDDLKLYGRNRQEIESLVDTVRIFSDDICMEFGFDKCASMSIHRGKIQEQVHPSLVRSCPLTKGSL